MWRPNSFPGNEGSDQSISDEDEEENSGWHGDCVSLGGTLDRKKESLGVASQLDLLKGAHKDMGFSSEDEVEIPDFLDQSNIDHQDKVEGGSIRLRRDKSICEPVQQKCSVKKESKMPIKSIRDGYIMSEALDLYTKRKTKFQTCLPPGIDEETRIPHQMSGTGEWPTHPSSYLNEKNPSMAGGKWKSKAEPSSDSKSHTREVSWSSIQKDQDPNSTSSDELLDEPEAIHFRPRDKSEHLRGSNGEKMSESGLVLPERTDMQCDHSRSSMAELLDHLKGKSSKTYLKPKMGHRRKQRIDKSAAVIKRVPSSGNNIMSDEDTDESVHSGSSTYNEEVAQKPELPIVESERKTMADKFQEAFGSAPVDNSRASYTVQKQLSGGLFGRLHKVMQWQKEQDSEFLKKVQTEVWPKDEGSCIDVKILSRSFDAKLTVCHCSLLENEESSLQNPQLESFGKTWTIIFNSRVCGDVDLEVGNLIRIHPPWKEEQVLRGGEIVILTTYFTQI